MFKVVNVVAAEFLSTQNGLNGGQPYGVRTRVECPMHGRDPWADVYDSKLARPLGPWG